MLFTAILIAFGDEKKSGTWSWHHNPFVGTREFNGLRVMMALLNNWDLKDENNAVLKKKPDDGAAKRLLAIALARLGKKQDAKSELEKFQKGDAPAHSELYLAAIVAAELGEGADKALEALEAAIGKQPRDAELRYDGARLLHRHTIRY